MSIHVEADAHRLVTLFPCRERVLSGSVRLRDDSETVLFEILAYGARCEGSEVRGSPGLEGGGEVVCFAADGGKAGKYGAEFLGRGIFDLK